ncbi:hypothetical protein BVF97_19820 [Bacillus thuringiensis]|uniref:Transposase n=1 Tax=Bacillus thuringiensis TaxID=1428 RepID=A0ABD6R5Q4_BACTU|nr:hypothetical protein BVF97_19820 [Bacillus thuringiensis]
MICHNINLLPFCYVDGILIGNYCLIPLFRGMGKETHYRKPKKYEHDEILHEVMNQIQEREIWIPNGEVKRYYLSKIGKWFRKIESEWESNISNSEKQQVLEEK